MNNVQTLFLALFPYNPFQSMLIDPLNAQWADMRMKLKSCGADCCVRSQQCLLAVSGLAAVLCCTCYVSARCVRTQLIWSVGLTCTCLATYLCCHTRSQQSLLDTVRTQLMRRKSGSYALASPLIFVCPTPHHDHLHPFHYQP